jgi:hypothetical protein
MENLSLLRVGMPRKKKRKSHRVIPKHTEAKSFEKSIHVR